jgi:hypothetical protein
MAMNSFGKRNFVQPVGRLSMHSWTVFFSLRGWARGEKDFILFYLLLFLMCFHRVPLRFSSSSQRIFKVPNVFSKTFLRMFPIAPQFYPIWFAQSSAPMDII